MNIKFKKSDLSNCLKKVINVISDNTVNISFKGVLIEIKNTEVIFVGSNGEVSCEIKIPIEFEQTESQNNNKYLIPGRVLLEVVEKENDEIITFVFEENKLIIKTNESTTEINYLNKDDYPEIDFKTNGINFVLDSKKFSDISKKVAFATSDSSQRIELNGINIKCINKKIFAIATDSYRLALLTNELNSDDFNLIINAKNFKEIISPDQNKKIDVTINKSLIKTRFDNCIYQSSLIDAKYVEVEQVIPNKFISSYNVNRAEFLSILDRVTVLSIQNEDNVKLTKKNEKIEIEAGREQIGNKKIVISSTGWEGEDLEIIFKAKYITQAIKSFETNKIDIKFVGKFKPFLITSNEETNLIQLVLPIRSY